MAYGGTILAEPRHAVEKWVPSNRADPNHGLDRGEESCSWITIGKTLIRSGARTVADPHPDSYVVVETCAPQRGLLLRPLPGLVEFVEQGTISFRFTGRTD